MSWEVRTMQSKTSYFNATLFRKNLTRFWPLWGLASFVGALFPLAVLLDMVHRGWNVLSAPDFTGMYYDAVSAVPVILYNDSLAAAVGSNRSMVEDGEMPNVASWYVNGTFLSAWYSAVDAEELPASAAAFVEMSRNAAFQSGTAAEGGAAMAAMG